ncbi:hypothetical protein KS4_31120 [Poriferisphaera corsica]|uniref:Uncharacterized protein n=1 Tax=Poriferisphaera corsica TaxID=2528020 RepID=A0A517YXT9_9BACT|nr:hypothetical protein KS4_31120 [Poriferisphaera corsica]
MASGHLKGPYLRFFVLFDQYFTNYYIIRGLIGEKYRLHGGCGGRIIKNIGILGGWLFSKVFVSVRYPDRYITFDTFFVHIRS